jgi:hypothetical protein
MALNRCVTITKGNIKMKQCIVIGKNRMMDLNIVTMGRKRLLNEAGWRFEIGAYFSCKP